MDANHIISWKIDLQVVMLCTLTVLVVLVLNYGLIHKHKPELTHFCYFFNFFT